MSSWRRIYFRWAVCVIATLLPTHIQAAEGGVKITGMYSSFEPRTGGEGADLIGDEMWIVWVGYGGYYSVALQTTSDGPLPLVTAKLTVKGDRISFIVRPPSFSAGFYNGRITAAGFDGYCLTKENGKTLKIPMHLKRGLSYWQKN